MKRTIFLAGLLVCLALPAITIAQARSDSSNDVCTRDDDAQDCQGSQSGQSQINKHSHVPQAVENAFNGKYPNITVKQFLRRPNGYVVSFVDNGERMRAYFNEDGSWIKTETQLTTDEVPKSLKKDIHNGQYGGTDIRNAQFIETPSDSVYALGVSYPTGMRYRRLYCTREGRCYGSLNDVEK